MDEKKSFFDLLDPTSALLVGLVGGVLALGTIGFLVLGVSVLKGGTKSYAPSTVAALPEPQAPTAPQPIQPPPDVPKSGRPKVELFVMSYCPFGLQTQKGILPAWALLKDKADIAVKFVSYAMHGQKEVEENTRQYCIEKQNVTAYRNYLQCFATSGDSESCLTTAGINKNTLNSCINQTDKQFGITAKYDDQSSWLSGRYPIYPIHEALNKQYGVQGSPTLVVNGVSVQTGRSPEELKQVICAAFNNPPAECGQTLSVNTFQAGFGMAVDGSAANAQVGCGT